MPPRKILKFNDLRMHSIPFWDKSNNEFVYLKLHSTYVHEVI